MGKGRGTRRIAVACVIGAVGALAATPAVAGAQAPPEDDRFEVTLLDKNITQGIRIATAPDGRVLLAERDGRLKIFKPDTGTTVVAGQIPTGCPASSASSAWRWRRTSRRRSTSTCTTCRLTPPYTTSRISRVSRFTLNGDTLDLASEKPIYDVQHPAYAGGGHSAGDLRVRAQRRPLHRDRRQHGLLRLAGLPADGRALAASGPPPADRQRRAGDVGQHEQPERQDPAHPPARRTRERPSARAARTRSRPGNMFTGTEDGGGKTLREIYAMGLRNPFTIGAAKDNGELWFADYGPDATLESPDARPGRARVDDPAEAARQLWLAVLLRPRQAVRGLGLRRARSRAATTTATTWSTTRRTTSRRRPARSSTRGLLDIPDDTPRTMWWTYSANSPTTPFDDLFGGGAMAGPRYQYNAANPSTTKFPEWFNDRYFFFEWTTDWVADRLLQRRRQRSRTAGRSCRSTRSSSRWTCSSAPTARSTCSPTATAGAPTTTTPACTASATRRATASRRSRPAPTRTPAARR